MATASQPGAPVRTEDYVIDPAASSVAFRTRHLFGLGGVQGNFSGVQGVVRVREPHTESTVEFSIPTATFSTGTLRQEQAVLSSTFLDVEKFPSISYRSTGIETDTTGVGSVAGALTAHGVERALTVDVQSVTIIDGDLVVEATATVDRFDFGVTGGKGMAGRRLKFAIRLVARA